MSPVTQPDDTREPRLSTRRPLVGGVGRHPEVVGDLADAEPPRQVVHHGSCGCSAYGYSAVGAAEKPSASAGAIRWPRRGCIPSADRWLLRQACQPPSRPDLCPRRSHLAPASPPARHPWPSLPQGWQATSSGGTIPAGLTTPLAAAGSVGSFPGRRSEVREVGIGGIGIGNGCPGAPNRESAVLRSAVRGGLQSEYVDRSA